MRTSVIESPQRLTIKDCPLPGIGDNEVLVKLRGSGLCASNLPVWEGREWFTYPFEPGSPGHEGYGEVTDLGKNVTGLSIGDKVTLISYHAYAEYDKALASNVVKLSPSFNGDPFPGEPLACAINIFKRSDITNNQTVVVVGTGFIGCLLIQLIKGAGANVVAVSRRRTSLKFAEKAGAGHMVQFSDIASTAKSISQLAHHGISRIIEVSGTQVAIDLATEIISERGKLIIAGYHQDGLRNINLQIWNWKGIDVINAHERNEQIYVEGMKEAIIKTEQGILRPKELITHFFELKDINTAFQTLRQRPEGFLKAVIVNS